jgi:hypothetical protein
MLQAESPLCCEGALAFIVHGAGGTLIIGSAQLLQAGAPAASLAKVSRDAATLVKHLLAALLHVVVVRCTILLQ